MYLGIDLGTSAVKACLMAESGQVTDTATAPLSLSHPFPGASEQNCEDWWQATVLALAALPAERRAQVRSIGLSGQMHGAVLLDRTLSPICPAILWNDARAEEECATLLSRFPKIGEVTGVWPMAGFTAPKLLWLQRNRPDLHARIAHVLLPKDFLGLRLHGELVTDPSDAAGTSWLDQQSGTWSEAACAASATRAEWLPQIRHGTEVAGRLMDEPARELGLPSGIPVAVGAGDAAAGAFGIGAVTEGDGFLSLGTSGQFFVTQRAYRPNVESRIHAYAHTHEGHWFNMAAMLNGARPMAWLAERLGRPIDALLSEAEMADQDDLIFLPYLTGERTPHGDSGLRAGFYGLGEGTGHGNLMRSVVEAIAFSFADAADAMSRAGTRTEALLAIGGGTRSDLLMQCLADMLETEMGCSSDADVGPALGAARLARLALEGGEIAALAPKPVPERRFFPRPEARERLATKRAAFRAFQAGLGPIRAALQGRG